MWCEPDRARLRQLRDLEQYRDKTDIIYCPRCQFQMPPETVGPSNCPDCRDRLMVSTVTEELRALVRAEAC